MKTKILYILEVSKKGSIPISYCYKTKKLFLKDEKFFKENGYKVKMFLERIQLKTIKTKTLTKGIKK